EWGERTRNIFLVVAALEIAALVPAVSRWRKGVLAASALAGLGGAVSLYQAADLGGDLVYAYAGGVGIRSGDPADVGRLLVAGLYHQAMLERKAGKPAEAAQLIGQLAQRYPDDTTVRLLAVESLIVDQHDGKAALAALKWFPAAPDTRFLRFRVGLLRADALAAAGMADWAKGTAILFAVGAVSGTVLSFELGLLWPEFMRFAGPIIGMPFSLEGFAFFTEAIFLGIYLYGWDCIPPRAHLAAGVIVALSGAASGVFVVIANAWMNAPTGFELVQGQAVNVDPLAAMANPAALPQALHMTLAAYAATGFAVAGIHAMLPLKDPDNAFHRRALAIALIVGAPAAVLQPVSGDLSARHVARHQPLTLAAAELLLQQRAGAPLTLAGWPDVDRRETRFAIEVPYALSLLAFHDPDAVVKGLDAAPRDEWPNVPAVHFAFQLMVALGTYLALVALWTGWRAWRGADLAHERWLLRAIAL